MKKFILISIICIVLIGCGKDGGIGPQGPKGDPGATGVQGPNGPGTRTIYTGTLPIAHATINIPGIDPADMVMVQVFVYMTPTDSFYGTQWVDVTTNFAFGLDTVYHYSTSLDGKPYKIVVIK